MMRGLLGSSLFPYTTLFRSRAGRVRPARPGAGRAGPTFTNNLRPAASAGAYSASSCFSAAAIASRSEEHTSELQSRLHLVCRLLLEKKKTQRHLYVVKSK